jgi:type I restriction enzyme, R subunit
MNHQSEQQLEKTLITQLNRLGFASVTIKDSQELEANLKSQLEKFNQVPK